MTISSKIIETGKMVEFEKLEQPKEGSRIEVKDHKLVTSDNPVLCYIEGDGVGPEITVVAHKVINKSVEKAYNGKNKIVWFKLYAGNEAREVYSSPLPKDTIEAIKYYRVCLKGPLTTPVGGRDRSLNVAIRQNLNLYACIRPVKYIPGVSSPVKHPERVNMVVFRENIEDVYAGIEWEQGSKEALEVIDFLNNEMGTTISNDSGVGIKAMSIKATKQLVRMAMDFALAQNRKSVTFVTKGNIMKYTEGAFRAWGYEVVLEEYRNKVITEQELWDKYRGKSPEDKLIIKDRLADDMLQQVLLYPERYDVIIAPNLNGDYLSDALAAQVGGIGIASSANIGHTIGVFEAIHGTAPDIAGKGIVNPTALILSGALMLEYLGWLEAAKIIRDAVETTIGARKVTKDLAVQTDDALVLSTGEFGKALLENI